LTSDIRLPPSAWGRRRSFYRTLSLPRKGRKVLGADLNCSESSRGSGPRAQWFTSPPQCHLPAARSHSLRPPHAPTALASKGRLIRCTVPGSTPNRLAITRTPGLPGVARASRIRFSSAGAIGGRPRRFPSLLARASPARTRSAIIARSNRSGEGEAGAIGAGAISAPARLSVVGATRLLPRLPFG